MAQRAVTGHGTSTLHGYGHSSDELCFECVDAQMTDNHALPDTNPLRRNTSWMRKFRKQHRSPLYQAAAKLKDISMEEKATIHSFTLSPWEKRVEAITNNEATRRPNSNRAAYIAVTTSARNGVIGLDATIKICKRV